MEKDSSYQRQLKQYDRDAAAWERRFGPAVCNYCNRIKDLECENASLRAQIERLESEALVLKFVGQTALLPHLK